MNKVHNIEYEEAPSGNVMFYNYKEPLMKFEGHNGIEGYGFQGALIFDGSTEQIQCHLCGQWFDSLGHHLNKEHAMTAGKYKEIVGLNKNTALINEKTRAKFIASGLEKRKKNLQNQKGMVRSLATRRKISATLKQNRNEQKNLRNTCPEQLLERFVRLVEKKGFVPGTKDKDFGFYDTLMKTYGSMKRVCEITGYPYRTPGKNIDAKYQKYPETLCVGKVRDFYDSNGKIPTRRDLEVGVWNKILRLGKKKIFHQAMKLDGRYRKEIRRRYTKDELLEFLRSFERINGRRPSYSDCKRGLLPHLSRYSYNFGSWKNALKQAFSGNQIIKKDMDLSVLSSIHGSKEVSV